MRRVKDNYDHIDNHPAAVTRGPWVSMGSRIRHMRETGVMDYIPTPPCYDDAPNHPSKSMEVDPTKQAFVDPFEAAESLGKAARKVIEDRAAAASSKPAEGE